MGVRVGGMEGLGQEMSIFEKLQLLYRQESKKKLCVQGLEDDLVPSSHLLSKLVAREHFNCLILNLFSGNEGYSLVIKNGNGLESETIKMTYEEDEFLTYIDNEELPPTLLQALEDYEVNLFYEGCVIVEIRDHRRTLNPANYETTHVLLRPTNQTLVCDINGLTSEGEWDYEDKLMLESELVLRTAEPLCLQPSPQIGLIQHGLSRATYKLRTIPMSKSVAMHSIVAQNRKRKFSEMPPPPSLRLQEFIKNKREKRKHSSSVPKQESSSWHEYRSSLDTPGAVDVPKFSKVMTPENRNDPMFHVPQEVEQYQLETEKSSGQVCLIRLRILQRPSDSQFIGELYVDRDYVEGKSNGNSCRFNFTSRSHVNKYIQQFTDIFTEEGKKPVKITQILSGQNPKITYTDGYNNKEKERNTVQAKRSATASSSLSTLLSTLAGGRNIPSQQQPQQQPVTVSTSNTTLTSLLNSIAGNPRGGNQNRILNVPANNIVTQSRVLVANQNSSTARVLGVNNSNTVTFVQTSTPTVATTTTTTAVTKPTSALLASLTSGIKPGDEPQPCVYISN